MELGKPVQGWELAVCRDQESHKQNKAHIYHIGSMFRYNRLI